MFYLFTYGTFMRNMERHYMLTEKNAKFISDLTISGVKMYDYDGKTDHYPVALISDSESDCIKGEVYQCDDKILPYLDYIEGVGSLYERYEFESSIDGEVKKIFIYVGIKKLWDLYITANILIPYSKTKWEPTYN